MNNLKENKSNKFTKKGYRKYQDEFIKKYQSGMSIRAISEEYNISKNIVSKYIREKIELRPKNPALKHKNEIFILYQSGFTIHEISNKLSISYNAVSRILTNEFRVRTTKMRKYEHLIDSFIEEYNQGFSAESIGRKYNVSRTTVLKYINEEGLKSRSYCEAGRKYDVIEDYFDNLTKEKAYLLGEYSVYAYIIQTVHSLALEFCSAYENKDLILRLSSHISSKDENNLELDSKFNTYKLRINTDYLCNKLKEYGFDSKINNKLLSDLGVIDNFYEGVLHNTASFNQRNIVFIRTKHTDSLLEYFDSLNIKYRIQKNSVIYLEDKAHIRELFKKLPYMKEMFLDYYEENKKQGPWTKLYEEYTTTENHVFS